jgi:signal transduction histidine kinase
MPDALLRAKPNTLAPALVLVFSGLLALINPPASPPGWMLQLALTALTALLAFLVVHHGSNPAELPDDGAEKERAREATLARMAAALAHEVRNPVAGMSAAVSTLRRYGDEKAVRDDTIDLIERGLQSIDHVAASMLSTYRPPEDNRDLVPHDLADLSTLLAPKLAAKQVELHFANGLAKAFPTSAEAVRQIALNLLLNAVDASPPGSVVQFKALVKDDRLSISVADSGVGLPDDALKVLTGVEQPQNPQARRLGLWLVHLLIDDVKGRLSISTQADAGTLITITIPPNQKEGEHV